ncbi:MAG: transketolase family protein [Lachnospiraceae bacterium]
MVEINSRTIKRWSRVGQRATFGMVMSEMADEMSDLVVLTADVSTSAGLERFRSQHPDKFYDMGISEQNMMGVATGLASMGNVVYTTTFAPFQTMRCLEHIRVNQGYMKQKLCFVGLGSGLYHIYLGNTHCCIEDFSVLRGIPNLTILSPADGASVAKCVEAAATWKESVYIRLSGGSPLPIVYDEDFDFEIGKANVLCEGTDVVIFATGTMVNQALLASKKLEEENISCTVVDVHTIKPIDKECVLKYKNQKVIVTIEEHNIYGGLGSSVAEILAQETSHGKQLMLGVKDFYPHETDYERVLDLCGLSVNRIVQQIKENI